MVGSSASTNGSIASKEGSSASKDGSGASKEASNALTVGSTALTVGSTASKEGSNALTVGSSASKDGSIVSSASWIRSSTYAARGGHGSCAVESPSRLHTLIVTTLPANVDGNCRSADKAGPFTTDPLVLNSDP